jgi:predicted nucleic acid-binding protein
VIVVDASAILEALLRTPAGTAVEARMFRTGETLHAPHLIDLEIAQVLRRHARRGWLTADHCRMVLDAMAEFPLSRYPHATLLPRVWALRDNLTAYDAAYVALAEMLDAPLVTRDRRLAAASGHGADVELL